MPNLFLDLDPSHENAHLCGAIMSPEETAGLMATSPNSIQTYSSLPRESGVGKKRFLWDYQRQVLNSGPNAINIPGTVVDARGDFHEFQTGPTCVSKALQRIAMMLWTVRIALQGFNESVPCVPASEAIYALGRIEIGHGRLGRGGGLVVSWGIQAVVDYGMLPRDMYGNIDLTTADDEYAIEWGNPNHGLPDQLEPIARQLPVKAFAPIKSWAELCTALYNGEPITDGCNNIPGNGAVRDTKGYIRLNGRGGHATNIIGYDDTGIDDDPWCQYDNASWSSVTGPNPHDGPIYGGKISRRTFEDVILRGGGEVFAVSDITGMPNQANLFDML